MWGALLAVAVGSVLGGWLRWFLSLQFNSAFTLVPPGTLIANLLGGYIIGFALGFFSQATWLSPEWRLLVMTGFCGGLTTFSTFSVETFGLLQQGRIGWALAIIGIHVLGSLLMTWAGLMTFRVVGGQ